MDIRPTLTSCPDSAVERWRLRRPVEIRQGWTTALLPSCRTMHPADPPPEAAVGG